MIGTLYVNQYVLKHACVYYVSHRNNHFDCDATDIFDLDRIGRAFGGGDCKSAMAAVLPMAKITLG